MRTIAIWGLGETGRTLAVTLAVGRQADQLVLLGKDAAEADGVAAAVQTAAAWSPRQLRVQDWAALAQADALLVALAGDDRARATQLAVNAKRVSDAGFFGVVVNLMTPTEATTAVLQAELALPPQRVVGLGTLAATRQLHSALAATVHQSPQAIGGFVYGQAGGRPVVAWSTVRVNGRPLDHLGAASPAVDQQEVATAARLLAYRLAQVKATPAVTVALAQRVLAAILQDEQVPLPLAVNQPQFGGYVSYPVLLGRSGVASYLLLDLYPLEEEQVKVARAAIADQEVAWRQLLAASKEEQ